MASESDLHRIEALLPEKIIITRRLHSNKRMQRRIVLASLVNTSEVKISENKIQKKKNANFNRCPSVSVAWRGTFRPKSRNKDVTGAERLLCIKHQTSKSQRESSRIFSNPNPPVSIAKSY